MSLRASVVKFLFLQSGFLHGDSREGPCYNRLPMRFLKKLFPFAIIAAAALLLLYLPDIGPERYTDLATFFRTELKRQSCPGYAVAVVSGGSTLYVDALGSDGNGKALTVDSPFLLGEAAWPLTGLLSLSLARDGFIDLDSSASTYVPSLPDIPGLSFRNFLAHTSGWSATDFDDLHPKAASLEEAVSHLAGARPSALPGQRARPIETGYQVLGLGIQRATELSFAELASLRIFRPLGMGRSSANPRAFKDGLPQGSASFFGYSLPRRVQVSSFAAASGAMTSTATDLAALLAYFSAPEKYPRTPVPARYLRATVFSTPAQASPWSYGWLVEADSTGGQAPGQAGELKAGGSDLGVGRSANLVLWPGERSGIAILSPQNGLIQNRFIMPSLVAGAHALIVKGEAARPFPFGRLFILLGVMALVHLFALAVQTGAALSWARDIRGRVEAAGSRAPLGLAIFFSVLGILVRLGLLALFPRAAALLLGQPLPWSAAFALEPGLAAWFMAALVGGMVRNIARLAWLKGPR